MIWLGEEFDFSAGAILNFNKPSGKSSFYVVKKVRSLINCKVGHAGTLDPFATGVLLICTGKATKKSSLLMDLPKTYIGEIYLGKTTNTDDITGKIVSNSKVPQLSMRDLQKVINKFIGEIEQIPPMFSAKKVKGRRLYKLARKGIEIDRKPSRVKIYDIRILDFLSPILRVEVKCSRGTYIRSLARDIGKEIGCGGFLKTLIRTRIGEFSIKDSLTLEDFQQMILEQKDKK